MRQMEGHLVKWNKSEKEPGRSKMNSKSKAMTNIKETPRKKGTKVKQNRHLDKRASDADAFSIR